MAQIIKNPLTSEGDPGSVPGSRRVPWRSAWQPTPVFSPDSPMGRGAWWAIVHRVAKSQAGLND